MKKSLLLIASLFSISFISAARVTIQNNIGSDVIAVFQNPGPANDAKITVSAGKQGEAQLLCFSGVTILGAKNKNVLAKFSNTACKNSNFVLEKPEGKDIQLIEK